MTLIISLLSNAGVFSAGVQKKNVLWKSICNHLFFFFFLYDNYKQPRKCLQITTTIFRKSVNYLDPKSMIDFWSIGKVRGKSVLRLASVRLLQSNMRKDHWICVNLIEINAHDLVWTKLKVYETFFFFFSFYG